MVMIDVASLYEAHAPILRAWLAPRVPNGVDVDDLVSETFLRAWRHHDAFTEHRPGYARSWLFMIAGNIMRDIWRLEPRRPLPLNEDVVATAAPSPERHIEVWDRAATLAPLLAALEDRQRAVVLGYYRDCLDQNELAERLGSTPNGIKKAKARALARMRRVAGVA